MNNLKKIFLITCTFSLLSLSISSQLNAAKTLLKLWVSFNLLGIGSADTTMTHQPTLSHQPASSTSLVPYNDHQQETQVCMVEQVDEKIITKAYVQARSLHSDVQKFNRSRQNNNDKELLYDSYFKIKDLEYAKAIYTVYLSFYAKTKQEKADGKKAYIRYLHRSFIDAEQSHFDIEENRILD